jgi:Sap, sulfolipid-1-addressing protein
MSELLPGLLVLVIGGTIMPPLLLLTILFLGSRRPLPNAAALALGYFATCTIIGILGLVLFGDAEGAVSTVGQVISVTVGILLLFLGLRNLLNAPDPDASPPGWMVSIDAMSPPRAFGSGMVLFPLQVKNLAIFGACLNLIIASNLDPERSASCSERSSSSEDSRERKFMRTHPRPAMGTVIAPPMQRLLQPSER